MLALPLAKPAWIARQTSPEVVAAINALIDDHTDGEIAKVLNERGLSSGTGKRFNLLIVAKIRSKHGLKSRYSRLRARGFLDKRELGKRLHVKPETIIIWCRAGLLKAHRFDDRGQCLFERPDADIPVKYKHQGKTRGRIGTLS